MLQRVVRLVGTVCPEVVVVAAPGQDYPPLPGGITIVSDRDPGQGPLEGLAAGLSALSSSPEFAFVTATDTPFLHPAWILRLHELIGSHDVAIPNVDGRLHPLAALYRTTTATPAVASLRAQGQRRLLLLAETLRTREVTAEELRVADPELKTLRNLNSPEDYHQALREIQSPKLPE